jgi:hypothetical protein
VAEAWVLVLLRILDSALGSRSPERLSLVIWDDAENGPTNDQSLDHSNTHDLFIYLDISLARRHDHI